MELDAFTHKVGHIPRISATGFHAGTLDIKSIMGPMQIIRMSDVLGMDIRIAHIRNMKYRYVIMQSLVHKIMSYKH